MVGAADETKGQVPIGFVVLKAGVEREEEELRGELKQMVRDEIGAIAALKELMPVSRLPKTRSGKVLRATIRQIADGREYEVPSTVEDPGALEEIDETLTAARS